MRRELLFCSMVLGALMLAVGTGAIAASSTPQTIPVGAVVSLTGFFSNSGNQVKAGYEIGVGDVNRARGVFVKEYEKKLPLEVIIQDSESSPTKVISMLEWLYTSKRWLPIWERV